MRMTEALRQVAENVQEMKKDRTGNPTTMKDAEKEQVEEVEIEEWIDVEEAVNMLER
jgi:hypothetical protein